MTEPTIWYYISKVTLKEAWEEFKSYLSISFGLLIAAAILWFINIFTKDSFLASANSEIDKFIKSIPSWILYLVIFGVVLWFGRGRKLPMLDFKMWLILMIIITLSVAAIAYLPWWLALPVYWIIGLPLYFLDKLTEIGKYKVEEENEQAAA